MRTAPPPALRGTLDDLPLRDVLSLLAQTSATGQLSVGGDHGGSVWIERGELYAAAMVAGPSMWDSFVRTGVVSASGWDAATAALRDSGESLADALVQAGGADPSMVERLLRDRVVTAVFELALQPGAPFEFAAADRHPAGRYRSFAVDDVVADVERRLASWRQIAAAIPSTGVVARIRRHLPDGMDELTLTAEQWSVLSALDGVRTVAEVVRALGTSAFDVCTVLHGLIQLGAVEVVGH